MANSLPRLFPRPATVFRQLDRRTPVTIKQLLVEPLLNRLFATAIAEGDFDDFEGRTVRLEVDSLEGGVTIGYWQRRLRVVEAPGEVAIKGDLQTFRELAQKRQDPDTLFFQRRLSIHGDTELGLGVKNLLDSIE